MKVDVYLNLNKDCVSVRSREREDYGTVVAHRDKVTVVDAEFVVQPGGLERVRETGIKNVHAFVRGRWNDEERVQCADAIVTYDPKKYDSFVEVEYETPIDAADVATVTREGVYTKNPKYSGVEIR